MSAQVDVRGTLENLCFAMEKRAVYPQVRAMADAVKELIAADLEYDAAVAAYEGAPTSSGWNERQQRLLAAEARRKAALAACEGVA